MEFYAGEVWPEEKPVKHNNNNAHVAGTQLWDAYNFRSGWASELFELE